MARSLRFTTSGAAKPKSSTSDARPAPVWLQGARRLRLTRIAPFKTRRGQILRRLIGRRSQAADSPRWQRSLTAEAEPAFGRFDDGIERTPDAAASWSSLMTAGRLTVGAHSYVHGKIFYYLGDHTSVHIGSFCSIADEVAFIPGGNHRSEWVTTFPLRVAFDLDGAFEDGNPSAKGDIVVGNDVWIGRRATILSGVHIGSGAVVAAGSVVSKDVSPYTIVAGNPAQEIRRRFSDDQVSRLLRLAWWDWPIERVLESADTLCSPDVESLLRREGL